LVSEQTNTINVSYVATEHIKEAKKYSTCTKMQWW